MKVKVDNLMGLLHGSTLTSLDINESAYDELLDSIEWDRGITYDYLTLETLLENESRVNWGWAFFVSNTSRYDYPEYILRKYSDKICWDRIYIHSGISDEFIQEYSDKIHWDRIMLNRLSEDLIRTYKDKEFNWNSISAHMKLSEEFISEFSDKLNWEFLVEYQKLSDKIIRDHFDKIKNLNLDRCLEKVLSEDFMRNAPDLEYPWDWISSNLKLSEEFISEFSDKVNWGYILRYQSISDEFIRDHFDYIGKLSWYILRDFMSEELMLMLKDKELPWDKISSELNLSEDFIRNVADKLNLNLIFKHQCLSDTLYDELRKLEDEQLNS